MVRHGESSACSYLANPTSIIPSHCASIVVTSTVRANIVNLISCNPAVVMDSTNARFMSEILLICKIHSPVIKEDLSQPDFIL